MVRQPRAHSPITSQVLGSMFNREDRPKMERYTEPKESRELSQRYRRSITSSVVAPEKVSSF
ncbi:hypothetical protein M407DRAFT_142941 [Tulasnella calospora MUT 4182]|uniref:Uncharacterized protein n=1 Tax=Tulasnella calospora MUT 4182 TaxID=1051891 RepID=A0A0C3Q8A5_9AGAM|nr:hypothetical protein M407DRAFT_142941 [Tulasnella calospora MUT 4182]